MVGSDDTGLVQVFDVASRAILRSIKAHTQPIHSVEFSSASSGNSTTTILTASDDATVRLFDLSTASAIALFDGHVDYVRSAVHIPSHNSLVISGSYDGTVKMWDARSAENEGEVSSVEHGFPVEKVLVHPSGTLAISAGGPLIRIWDLLSGVPRCLKALSNHQKTVTSLAWDGQGRRMLSGALDGLVKVYDASEGSWRVQHTMRYGGQITSLALSVRIFSILCHRNII